MTQLQTALADNTLKNAATICGLDWIRRKTRPRLRERPIRTYSLVDLFCGCGGLSLGIREALRLHGSDMEIKLAVDYEEQALMVYKKNLGVNKQQIVSSDIGELLPGDIGSPPGKLEREFCACFSGVDILAAGPPCQGHSDLNNSTRRRDPRNRLYLKAVRFVELAKPRVVLIENVPAAVHDSGNVVEKSQLHLREMGYKVKTLFVDAYRLGLPQTRKRHILIAVIGDAWKGELELGETAPGSLHNYLYDIIDECNTDTRTYCTPSRMTEDNKRRVCYLFDNDKYDLPDSERPDCHKDKEHSYVSMYGRLSWEKPAQTITSGFGSMGQGRFIHPERERVLTPHEAARIQGIPDFCDFSSVTHRTALHEMIGNAVPPRIAATIISDLCNQHIL